MALDEATTIWLLTLARRYLSYHEVGVVIKALEDTDVYRGDVSYTETIDRMRDMNDELERDGFLKER